MISIITLGVVFILIAGATLTFLKFVKIGVPLTVINAAVYWAFLLLN